MYKGRADAEGKTYFGRTWTGSEGGPMETRITVVNKVLRRKGEGEPNGAMVGDSADVARAGIGPERFGAAIGPVRDLQEGDGEDVHPGRKRPGTDKEQVDQVPSALVFDTPPSLIVERFSQRSEQGLQQFVHGVVRRVVEIAHGDDPLFAQGVQGVRQSPEPLYGKTPARPGNGRSAILGRVMVHQDGKRAVRARKTAKKDISGGKDRVGLIEMAGVFLQKTEPGAPVKQRHVYSPGVRRIRMYHPVV
jgi:hypothetical protein